MFQSIGSPLEPAMPLRQRSPAWLAVFLLGLCLFDVSFALPAVVVGQNTYTGWHCAFLSLGVGFITVRDPGHGGVPLLLAGFGNFAVLGFLALRAFRVSARLRFGLALFVLLATIPGSLRSLLARHATLLPGYFLWIAALAILAVGELAAPKRLERPPATRATRLLLTPAFSCSR